MQPRNPRSSPPTTRQWGGRFSDSPDILVQEFGQSIEFDRRLFQEDILGSVAHCRMLGQVGILTEAEARTIEDGLRQIAGEAARGEVAIDHALEDVHTHVEARLGQIVGPVAGKLHTARSRNDQIALDMRLFLRSALLDTVDGLVVLQQTLLDRAEAWRDVVVPGFTHTQRAQPVLLAHHLLAYHEMLGRDIGRLKDAYPRLNALPLGAGALAGVAYPIDRQLVAKLLGFGDISRNSLDTVGDRDFIVEYVAATSLIMTHLSRLAEEIVLWTTSEFGYMVLADSFTTGSSIMPQKKNSDPAELVRGKVGRVHGHLIGLLVTLKALPLAYNRDLQEDKEALFDTVDTVLPCLAVTNGMLRSAEIRRERLAEAAAAGFSLATDVADYLVARGLPFREAHRIVGQVVQRCLATGRDLASLPLEDYRAFSPLFEADVHEISAWSSVAARDVVGGTAPDRVAAELAAAHQAIALLQGWARTERAQIPSLTNLPPVIS